jgi:transcriptional regulator with XRE-family HTH domain
MTEFWERVKIKIQAENTTMEWVARQINIRPDSFRRWSSRKILPNAEKAVGIASALNTTVEFLVTGEEPEFLPAGEIIFYRQALKWRTVIEDLEILSPAVANGFCIAIHTAAKEVVSATKGMGIEPHAENQ